MPSALPGSDVKVEAFIFDVFGTCVDWRTGIAREVARVAAVKNLSIDAYAFADAWRGLYQPAMEKIRSGGRGYVDLDVLHGENLDVTLEAFGVAGRFEPAEREALNRAWEKLPPWPDVREGLAQLRRLGLVAACSNGSIALMTRLARYGDLRWDCILGAGVARAFKPDPAAYLRSCAALRLPPESVMMVAAHADDLAAARACGLRTGFVHRPDEYGGTERPHAAREGDWDIVSTSIGELAGLAADDRRQT